MDYFVSAENITFHHWQLELLIESFRLHNLEDNLVIALAETHIPCYKDFRKNLPKHKRLFYHENIGRTRDFVRFNKQFALKKALENNLLQNPFTVIDPDMVLVNPVNNPENNVLFQIDTELNAANCENKGCNISKYAKTHLWLPLGNVLVFNNIPNDLPDLAINWTQTFLNQNAFNSLDKWKYIDRIGWAMALLDYYGYISYKATADLEMTMLHNANCNFIHYTHGLPPVFTKYMFQYNPPDLLAANESPYHALIQENPTASTNYIKNLIQKFV